MYTLSRVVEGTEGTLERATHETRVQVEQVVGRVDGSVVQGCTTTHTHTQITC